MGKYLTIKNADFSANAVEKSSINSPIYELSDMTYDGTKWTNTQYDLLGENNGMPNWVLFISWKNKVQSKAGQFWSFWGIKNDAIFGCGSELSTFYQIDGGVGRVSIINEDDNATNKVAFKRENNYAYFSTDGINWTKIDHSLVGATVRRTLSFGARADGASRCAGTIVSAKLYNFIADVSKLF